MTTKPTIDSATRSLFTEDEGDNTPRESSVAPGLRLNKPPREILETTAPTKKNADKEAENNFEDDDESDKNDDQNNDVFDALFNSGPVNKIWKTPPSSPSKVAAPSARTSPFSTFCPGITRGFWLLQVRSLRPTYFFIG